MGQVLHGSAKTTHAVRAELQRSHASSAELARRFGINEKMMEDANAANMDMLFDGKCMFWGGFEMVVDE